jgi:hypothetical protein
MKKTTPIIWIGRNCWRVKPSALMPQLRAKTVMR